MTDILQFMNQFQKMAGILQFMNQFQKMTGAFLLGAGVSKFSKIVITRNLRIPWEIYTQFWIALGEPYAPIMVRRSKSSILTIFWKKALSY